MPEAVTEQTQTTTDQEYKNPHVDKAIESSNKTHQDLKGLKTAKHSEKQEAPIDLEKDQPVENEMLPESDEPEETTDDKFKRLQEKTQRRIDKIIAEKKSLEDRLKAIEESTQKVDDSEEVELKTEYANIVKQLDDIEDKYEEARLDGNAEEKARLRKEKRTLEGYLQEIRADFKELHRKKEDAKVRTIQERNASQWNESWREVRNDFPEIFTSQGTLRVDDPLANQILNLMSEDAVKGNFYNWGTDNRINPKYDNPNGPLMAAYRAAKILGYKNDPNEVEAIKNKRKSEDSKKQMISSSQGVSSIDEGRVTRAKLDKLEAEAFAPGVRDNDPKRIKYLKALREFEGR